ncbi:MAG: excinuclease ABC subunit UvrB [Christensenellaceae bacterium]|jgi:excinuclease ABC subunit B|nr:excinuclease ABC subunit UvrB [Christensenellaceae bacterium]
MEYFKFKLESAYAPCGDQPEAIEQLINGIECNERLQVLLGVTGSGKTFTMANIINKLNRPALVIAHNKTLAAQLCNEFKELFPHNRVEYFVSYYDYFQPEAYIPRTDTYIEKGLEINDEIDRLRNSATSSLVERNDVIVVASVSCIYGLGAPENYLKNTISLRPGDIINRDTLIDRLASILYKRNDISFERSTFRVRGDILDIFPSSYNTKAVRIEFFEDEIEKLIEFDVNSGKAISALTHISIPPATHYFIDRDENEKILDQIRADLHERVKYFKSEDKLIEAQRLKERVNYDLEMIREMGYCSGVENYSRYFDRRLPGTAPFTLIDYFPDNFIVFIDESHITLPQIRGMFSGDFSRKQNLVNFGFRLPAAFDNRPLNFDEFNSRIKQLICVSATPADYELNLASRIVEQVVRPTGLIEPPISIRKTEGQIDDLISEINSSIKKGGRSLVTTLTKKMAESLTNYLREHNIKVEYMHSDVDTLDRIEIITRLRKGDIDVVVGINLLREGLDIPEVLLVAILDADKEGFLRSRSSLIQTVGRAARNRDASVIFYADVVTNSMKSAIDETDRRRSKQIEYNTENNITPRTIIKPISNTLMISKKVEDVELCKNKSEIETEIDRLTELMKLASDAFDFETAIIMRDRIASLKKIGKKKNQYPH